MIWLSESLLQHISLAHTPMLAKFKFSCLIICVVVVVVVRWLSARRRCRLRPCRLAREMAPQSPTRLGAVHSASHRHSAAQKTLRLRLFQVPFCRNHVPDLCSVDAPIFLIFHIRSPCCDSPTTLAHILQLNIVRAGFSQP